jgi:hypothetical protein
MRQFKTKVISWLLILVMVLGSSFSFSTWEVSAAENENVESASYEDKLEKVTDYLKQNNATPAYGKEWVVMQQARAGRDDREWYQSYYQSVRQQVKENIETMSVSACARTVIALTAIGADSDNIVVKKLLKKLTDFDEIQYVTDAIYTLIALDTKNYTIPETSATNPITREKLITFILSNFNEDGCISWGSYVDIDSTAMALQALAPYNGDDHSNVKDLVEKTLSYLSSVQNADGSFDSYADCCSTAQVLCGLSALGIDARTDTRFVKNDCSVVDVLLSYCQENGAIYGTGTWDTDLTSEQAAYALTAYNRLKNDKKRLYDMSDVSEKLYTCEDGHVWDEEYTVDKYACVEDGSESIHCTKCDEIKKGTEETIPNQGGHIDGTATCTKKAVCSRCGEEYGELDANNHVKTELQNVKEATCTSKGYTGDTVCSACGEIIVKGEVVAKKEHTPVKDAAVEATETKEGKTEGSHCAVCNEVLVAQQVIPATGKQVTTEEQNIETPKKTSIAKLSSPKKKQIKVTWKKKTGVNGYQIQVSTSSKFKKSVTKSYTIKSEKTTSKLIKSLKSKKKYYVRIRTYKTATVNGKKITKYSAWSAKKTIKVK